VCVLRDKHLSSPVVKSGRKQKGVHSIGVYPLRPSQLSAGFIISLVSPLPDRKWISVKGLWNNFWELLSILYQFCIHSANKFGSVSYHTPTHLTALFPGLPRWASTRKVKPIWILLKQETVSGSGISWAIMQVCTSLQTDNHARTPPLSFLQAGCPSCRPTNSVKALKANLLCLLCHTTQLLLPVLCLSWLNSACGLTLTVCQCHIFYKACLLWCTRIIDDCNKPMLPDCLCQFCNPFQNNLMILIAAC